MESLLRNVEPNGFLERRAVEVVAEEYASEIVPDLTGREVGTLRRDLAPGRGRYGRGLQSSRYVAQARRGDQDLSRTRSVSALNAKPASLRP